LELVVEETLLKGNQPRPQSILCLASYKPLHKYEWYHLLTITNDIEEVFTRQVREPQQEILLKAEIPNLKEITDNVSSKVKQLYEENPYPRWVNLALSLNPDSISRRAKAIKLRLSQESIIEVDAPKILIAGCLWYWATFDRCCSKIQKLYGSCRRSQFNQFSICQAKDRRVGN
jgi:hypothetical protein